MQDPAVAERLGGSCTAVASGVTLCPALPASGPAGMLHDVPAHRPSLAAVDLVADADSQTQQVLTHLEHCRVLLPLCLA